MHTRFQFSADDDDRTIGYNFNRFCDVSDSLQLTIRQLDTDHDVDVDGGPTGVHVQVGFLIPVSSVDLADSRDGLMLLVQEVEAFKRSVQAAANLPAPVVEVRKHGWCGKLMAWLLGVRI